jgi:hypothetical protein
MVNIFILFYNKFRILSQVFYNDDLVFSKLLETHKHPVNKILNVIELLLFAIAI